MDLTMPSISKGQWSLSNDMQAGWILNSNNARAQKQRCSAKNTCPQLFRGGPAGIAQNTVAAYM